MTLENTRPSARKAPASLEKMITSAKSLVIQYDPRQRRFEVEVLAVDIREFFHRSIFRRPMFMGRNESYDPLAAKGIQLGNKFHRHRLW
jgi:hypothetical protein